MDSGASGLSTHIAETIEGVYTTMAAAWQYHTPSFSTGFEPLARVTPYLNKRGLRQKIVFGAVQLTIPHWGFLWRTKNGTYTLKIAKEYGGALARVTPRACHCTKRPHKYPLLLSTSATTKPFVWPTRREHVHMLPILAGLPQLEHNLNQAAIL